MNSLNSYSEIEIPSDESSILPTAAFIRNAVERYVSSEESARIESELKRALTFTIRKNQITGSQATIRIRVGKSETQVGVEIQNHGTPVFPSDYANLLNDSVKFENRRRDGQVLRIASRSVDSLKMSESSIQADTAGSKFQIRIAEGSDAEKLSQLFYKVYRYRYINDSVYDATEFRRMWETGKLTSIVAESEKQDLIGHVGLMHCNSEPPVYEAALGVVDPSFKGNGVFGKIFSEAIAHIEKTPMQYCVYDFVTNHDFSQRHVAKHGFCDLALFIGNQVAETQASLEDLGIGKDPIDMDRYSLLVAVNPRVAHPFGKRILLPANIGEAFEFLLKPLNLEWVPAPRFYPMPSEGDFSEVLQQEQRSIIFDLHSPGRAALKRLIERWREALKSGVQYAAVDVALDQPGIGQVYDALAKHGFFMAGFVPYRFSSRLGFRFQFLSPTKVDFNSIKLVSKNAKLLLDRVRANYERNQVL